VKATTSNEPSDFSLVLGEPLYQLYLRTWLARAPIELLHRRIITFVLITWVPLWLLTAISLRNCLFIGASGSRFRNSSTAGRFANQYAREEFT
jgi:hypothetical protein